MAVSILLGIQRNRILGHLSAIENKYKLIQVDKSVIIFEFQGKKFTINNRFSNE